MDLAFTFPLPLVETMCNGDGGGVGEWDGPDL